MSTLPNLKVLPFGGAGAVQDPDQLAKIKDIKIDLLDVINDDAINDYSMRSMDEINDYSEDINDEFED